MAMFGNVGRTLGLLRLLRGRSQVGVAKQAGMGKGQLSRYENAHELPKLDTLEKLLNILGIPFVEFFYALNLVDRLAAFTGGKPGDWDSSAVSVQPLYTASLPQEPSILDDPTHQAFSQLSSDVLRLHQRLLEQKLQAAVSRPASKRKSRTRKRRSSQRAAASSPPRSASPR
jgi:transcriptional regulator with XRE-family HTH domain